MQKLLFGLFDKINPYWVPYVVCCKVFSSFASAAIRIRTSGIKKFLRPSSDEGINENVSQYNFGMVLKETMLNLGPTFIKGEKVYLVEVFLSIRAPILIFLVMFFKNLLYRYSTYCSSNYMLGLLLSPAVTRLPIC